MMNEPNEKREKLLRLLAAAALLLAFLGLGYGILAALGLADLTQEEVREFVASTGTAAPLIYTLVAFLQTTLLPIPGAVTILAGTYLFGAWSAFLYSYIGAMLGSIVAFACGRRIGRPFVDWVTGSAEETERWQAKLKGREGVLLFYMFLFPFFPDDLLCAVAGILPISWRAFLLMQIVTRTTSIGCTVLFLSGEVIPFRGWGIAVLIAAALLLITAFFLSMKYTREIEAFTLRTFEKISTVFQRKK